MNKCNVRVSHNKTYESFAGIIKVPTKYNERMLLYDDDDDDDASQRLLRLWSYFFIITKNMIFEFVKFISLIFCQAYFTTHICFFFVS